MAVNQPIPTQQTSLYKRVSRRFRRQRAGQAQDPTYWWCIAIDNGGPDCYRGGRGCDLDFGNEVTTTSPRLPTYDILPRMPSEAIHTDELYSWVSWVSWYVLIYNSADEAGVGMLVDMYVGSHATWIGARCWKSWTLGSSSPSSSPAGYLVVRTGHAGNPRPSRQCSQGDKQVLG